MKLLVATDGSKNALRAAREALKLLEKVKDGGSISLISVHDDFALRRARRFIGKQGIDDYIREESEKDLADARKLIEKAGIVHEVISSVGQIAVEIAETADKGKFDMIVLGSKGRTAFKDLMIGSVATRVVELAKTPVLLVR